MTSLSSQQESVDETRFIRPSYRFGRTVEKRLLPVLLLSPAIAFMAAVIGYPLLRILIISFQAYNLTRPDRLGNFVFLKHYLEIIQDSNFWHSLTFSAQYTIAVTIGSFVLGLGLALLVNHRAPFLRVSRVALAIPWAIPSVVAALTWKWMFESSFGVINYLLQQIGFQAVGVAWLVRPTASMILVILLGIWKMYPFSLLVVLAGLQAIPNELFEAAEIDGAGFLAKFRYITWPSLGYVNSVAILLTAVVSFREFEAIFLLTEGGPARATETLSLQLYLESFQRYDFGYASAIGMVMLMFSLLFAYIFLRLSKTDFY